MNKNKAVTHYTITRIVRIVALDTVENKSTHRICFFFYMEIIKIQVFIEWIDWFYRNIQKHSKDDSLVNKDILLPLYACRWHLLDDSIHIIVHKILYWQNILL